MTIFEDLPSTNTPINAMNLNNNFNAINSRPYIESAGTSGIWTYRKWSDGIGECWATYETETYASSSWGQWGGGLYVIDHAIPRINLPYTFIETPVVNCTPIPSTGNYWLYTNGQGSTTQTPEWGCARGSTLSYDFKAKVHLYVIGKWK